MASVADLWPPEEATSTPRLASWYTPGRTDGFGDRLLMFDHGEPDGLELLRFHPTLGATPGFEEALRTRVGRLATLKSPAFASIRAVERLEADAALALVSIHTPGRPLSELLDRPPGALDLPLVTWTVREAVAALTTLHGVGSDIAHGALSADRIVVTPDGQLKIVEHVLGAALAHLALSPAQAWSRFSVLVPPGEAVCRFDPRTDVFQIGALVLSMLLARRITGADVPTLPLLLAQWSHGTTHRGVEVQRLRCWLEMALQIAPGNNGFATAAEAYQGLRQLPPPPEASGLSLLQSIAPPPVETMRALPAPIDGELRDSHPRHADIPSAPRALLEAGPTPSTPKPWSGVPVWVAVAITAIAVGEAALGLAIWRTSKEVGRAPLVASEARTGAAVLAAPQEQPVLTPIAPAVVQSSAGAPSPTPATVTQTYADIELLTASSKVIAARSAGIRLVTPIELHVVEGDRVLGSSTAGAIIAAPGTHDLELINTALGVHVRRAVTFRPGQVTPITIPPPRGRISINANPWAEVWIDDRSVGETPLANLDVAVGEHAIVFRHPQFGERRESVVVRADADARVSATFQP